jgi:hypothetical protein
MESSKTVPEPKEDDISQSNFDKLLKSLAAMETRITASMQTQFDTITTKMSTMHDALFTPESGLQHKMDKVEKLIHNKVDVMHKDLYNSHSGVLVMRRCRDRRRRGHRLITMDKRMQTYILQRNHFL